MNYSRETFLNAMACLDELKQYTDKTAWHSWQELQLPVTGRQAFRALRLLQENRLVESKIEGEGPDRYKVYRIKNYGYRQMAELPQNDEATTNAVA
jgi:hypothetical protein